MVSHTLVSTEAIPHDDESDDGNDGRHGEYGHHGQGHGQGPRATKGMWRNQGQLGLLMLIYDILWSCIDMYGLLKEI